MSFFIFDQAYQWPKSLDKQRRFPSVLSGLNSGNEMTSSICVRCNWNSKNRLDRQAVVQGPAVQRLGRRQVRTTLRK